MKKIHVERELKNGWTRWVQPQMRGYIMSCCDCGLAHRLIFRVRKITKKRKNGYDFSVPAKGHIVQFKAQRAPAYTKRDRRKARRAA